MTDIEKDSIIAEIEKWENQLPGLHGKITVDILYKDGKITFIEVFPKQEKVKM